MENISSSEGKGYFYGW